MILQDIKETKRMDSHSDGRSDVRTDNVKTVYPPTNTVCGGYNQYETVGGVAHTRYPLSITLIVKTPKKD